MQQRQLGAHGPEVPVIGLGAWPLGGGMGPVEKETAINTIRYAIDHGITLIDTAQAYRTSETVLGDALKDGYRARCFLATKVSRDYSPSAIRAAMENSLRELGVDFVDLYQIHGWNATYPIEESMATMAELQQEGKTRYIGVSNFSAKQMAQAMQVARFHSNQPRYNLFDRDIEGVDITYCAEHGVGILAHSPLAKGLLTGKYTPDTKFPENDERRHISRFQGDTFTRYLAVANRLQTVARSKELTLVQLSIAWQLRLPAITCVLVGAKNPQQVAEHLGAVGIEFTQSELDEIDAIVADAP